MRRRWSGCGGDDGSSPAPPAAPEWNVNTHLVDHRGRIVVRFGAGTEPDAPELVGRIERLL
jgi:glutathione peroxidase-family protein